MASSPNSRRVLQTSFPFCIISNKFSFNFCSHC
jgi:hypothetical protein